MTSNSKSQTNDYTSYSASGVTPSYLSNDFLSESNSANSIWDNIFDDEGEEGEFSHEKFASTKDCIVFLIDSQADMFIPTENNEIPFQNAVRCAIATYTDKIISSDTDLISVCFYGTNQKKNLNEFENIFVLQDLDVPDAQRILELENLLLTEQPSFGSTDSDFPFCDALWTCSTLFSNCTVNVGHKRIFLFTNEDNPNAGNHNMREQSFQRAKDLSELGIDIELFSMNKSSNSPFDATLFYKNIISFSEEDEHLGHLSFDASGKFEELRARVRRKEFKKRSLGKLPLTIIRSDIEIGVRLYNLVQECKPASPVVLEAKSNQRVKTVTKWICADTAAILLKNQMKKYYHYGGEKVIFENDEIDSIKALDKTPGVRVVGFKPIDALKHYYHIRSSSFIYPDESLVKGGTVAFIALLDRLIYMEKVAIARFTARARSAPRFVALLPQREELDEDGIQITPPGFHVIYLPFADDLRNLDLPKTDKATEGQVLLAKKVVKSLRIKFDSRSFENPSLQKYYSNLQALALERETVDVTPDYVQPDLEGMDHFQEKILEFRDSIFGENYSNAPTLKRKRERVLDEDGNEVKRVKKEKPIFASFYDYAHEENVKTFLTIPALKEFLKSHNIKVPTGAKKQDLVDLTVEFANEQVEKEAERRKNNEE